VTTPEPPRPADEEPARVEVGIDAPPEAVWRALREPEQIDRWFGWEYDGLDDEVRMIFEDGAHVVEEGAVVQFGGHRFTLVAGDGRTVVRVTRCAPVVGEAWDDIFSEDVEEGWLTFLQQLRLSLERHPGEARRTVFLQGAPSAPTPVADVLGLGAVAGLPTGAPYRAVAAPGDELEGELWFRSDHQLGLTVAAWGDGLLVLSTSSTAPAPPPVMAVLTTYGLDEAALADLQRRWEAWWSTAYQPAG
jgi:uncharacterized protein YndB with AHSA1/START domain